MKTKDEITRFFNTVIKPDLEELDAKRELVYERFSFKKFGILLIVFILGLIATFIALKNNQVYSGDKDLGIKFFAIFFFTLVALLIIWFKLRDSGTRPLRKVYINNVVLKVIKYIAPFCEYDPENGITKTEFDSTGLFSKQITFAGDQQRINSYAQMSGNLSGTNFKAAYLNTIRDNKGNTTLDSSTTFYYRGLYGIIITKESYSNPLILRCKTGSIGEKNAQKITELLGHELLKTLTGKLVIKDSITGVDKIDEIFSIQCADPVLVKKFLESEWIELFMKLRKVENVRFDACFTGSQLHIAFYGLNMSNMQSWVSYVLESPTSVILHQYNLFIGFIEDIRNANL